MGKKQGNGKMSGKKSKTLIGGASWTPELRERFQEIAVRMPQRYVGPVSSDSIAHSRPNYVPVDPAKSRPTTQYDISAQIEAITRGACMRRQR